jgi:hypothetical protein
MICYNWGKRAQQPTSALRQLGEGISPISWRNSDPALEIWPVVVKLGQANSRI